jgi:hypothetical protein
LEGSPKRCVKCGCVYHTSGAGTLRDVEFGSGMCDACKKAFGFSDIRMSVYHPR